MRLTTQTRQDSLWDFMSEMERAFTGRELEAFTPAVDLHETEDFFLISADLPGVDQKNVKIDVQDGRLSLSGERTREERQDDGKFKRWERAHGKFERIFQLPQNVDEEKIQARFENGVLEVMIPKAEVAKPRSIQVESGKGGLFSRLMGSKKVEEKNH